MRERFDLPIMLNCAAQPTCTSTCLPPSIRKNAMGLSAGPRRPLGLGAPLPFEVGLTLDDVQRWVDENVIKDEH